MSDERHKCHANQVHLNSPEGVIAMCGICKRLKPRVQIVPFRYPFSEQEFENHVTYPGKKPVSFSRHSAAIAHANYVYRNPHAMENI